VEGGGSKVDSEKWIVGRGNGLCDNVSSFAYLYSRGSNECVEAIAS